MQDGQGYLWLGTLNGLCRYDGYRFVTYTHATDSLLLENRILSLHLNRKNGLLWVKQRGYYISCYDTHRGQFVDYSTAGQTKIPYRNITTMPDGKTWLWTENGPCRWVSLARDEVQSGAMSWSQMPVAMRDSLKTMTTLPTMPVSGTVITDDYVRKPFNAQLLRMRCVKLIEMRRKRRPVPSPSPGEGSLDNSSVDNSNSNSYQAPLPSGGAGSGLITTEQDRRFLQTLDRLITEKMSNMDLSVDELASHFRMGRSKFFEKVKDITGKTPNNYIRDYRLDRACELLSTEDLTVAKVAYQVGFSDPFYFSTVFKRKYGITPSRWQKGERLT